jgi:hypothetical protein
MLKNQAFRKLDDHTYKTADELLYIKKLGAHRLDPEGGQVTTRKTNLHKLPPDELNVIMKRLNAKRRRANWSRARGMMPPPPLTTKADWLRAYIRVAARRDDWGDIDPQEAVDAAKTFLEKQTAPFNRHVFGA